MKKKSLLNKISEKIQETAFDVAVVTVMCGYMVKMFISNE